MTYTSPGAARGVRSVAEFRISRGRADGGAELVVKGGADGQLDGWDVHAD